MIPGPLVAPAPSRSRRTDEGRAERIAGGILLVGSLLALLFWLGALSPYGFPRWSLLETGSVVTLRQPGTYVVFLERDGVSHGPPPAVSVSVLAVSGRRVTTQPLGDGAFTYDVPGHEGRAIATFEATRPGQYRVDVFPTGGVDLGQLRTQQVAVSRDLAVTWLATPLGLVVLVVAPAAVGAALLVAGRRARARSAEPG